MQHACTLLGCPKPRPDSYLQLQSRAVGSADQAPDARPYGLPISGHPLLHLLHGGREGGTALRGKALEEGGHLLRHLLLLLLHGRLKLCGKGAQAAADALGVLAG